MEETFNENTEPTAETATEERPRPAEKPRPSWKEWLGTDDAVRLVYLIFGFCFIVLLMARLQFSTEAVCCGDWDGY
jgi:hypothetical protein